MGALRTLVTDLERLATMLVFRYRSSEAAEAIQGHIEEISEIRSPAQARDILGEILQSPRGAIKPPQLEQLLRAAVTALFNAMDATDATAWPQQLLLAQRLTARMFDPYGAATSLTRLSTGALLITLGPEVGIQSPAASHSNSVVVSAAPATSRRVTPSPSGKVRQATGAQAMTA